MQRNGKSQIALKTIMDGTGLIDPTLRVELASTIVTRDHPATRYIAFLVGRLRRTLTSTAGVFEAVGNGRFDGLLADEGTKARASHLSKLMRAAVIEIQEVERSGLLAEVTPAAPSETTLQAITGHPHYARAHTLIRRLLDPGLHISTDNTHQDAILSALRPTYDLFELFVLHRLKLALIALLGRGWTFEEKVTKPSKLLAHDGTITRRWIASSEASDVKVELAYQPTFRSHGRNVETEGLRSLSGERRPDFTIAVVQGAEPLAWVCSMPNIVQVALP